MTRRWVALWVALGLLGCGGGGSGTPNQQLPLSFEVTAVTPFDASEDVPLTQEINVVFSRPVDEGSLTPTSLEVVAESGDIIPGDRKISPLTRTLVRFLPRVEYFPFAIHKIRVSREVLDEEGEPLDQDYEFVFRTEEKGPVLPGQEQLEDLGNLLRVGRFFHRMTLISNSRFLITGGYSRDGGPALGSAENMIPSLRQSTIIPSPMRSARAGHIQIALDDGRVLIAGGEGASSPFTPLASCEIFDPAPGIFAFTDAAPMFYPRSLAHATRLADGRVLVTGGQSVDANGSFIFRADAEIYDPASDTWSLVNSRMERGRSAHFSGRTLAGDVIIIGGTTGSPGATLFQTATETFSPQLGSPFFEHFFGAGTAMADGRPFVAGGVGTRGLTIWSPQFGFIGAVNLMQRERAFATATTFRDGRVVIVGGMNLSTFPTLIHTTIDVFFPIGSTGKFFPATDLALPEPMSHHAAALDPDGSVWLCGGITGTATSLRRTLILHPE